MAKGVERVVLALSCGAVGALWALLLRMLRQQGRLLTRIEALEAERAERVPHAGRATGGAPVAYDIGAPFPPFTLPDVSGSAVSLGDLASRRILLVNWDPSCGFCDQMAAALTDVADGLARHDTELVLISRGTPERNRSWAAAAGVSYRILLQQDAPIDAFALRGTPVAYLVNERRQVAAPLATGADAVLELARAAARGRTALPGQRPLSQSRIERDGLKPGTPAPEFTLPDLDGGEISLADFRGRRVLLMFSDADCGPCDEAAAELAELAASRPDDAEPAIVMIGRGDVESNRRKVAEHGIPFPVLVQPGWTVSRRYGIFATPVAFLVSEDSVIAAPVAKGPGEVLALAGATRLPVMFSEGSAQR